MHFKFSLDRYDKNNTNGLTEFEQFWINLIELGELGGKFRTDTYSVRRRAGVVSPHNEVRALLSPVPLSCKHIPLSLTGD